MALSAAGARAQSNLERFNRQLEQIHQDSLTQPSKDVPVGQRALLDYGGYFTFDYLTVDDQRDDNHVLKQYDTVLYTRLNFDGAHEFFIRARGTFEDFNAGDSFNGRGDQWINQEVIDRAYYRFDLAKSEAAYHGRDLSYNITAEAGRDLVYWGTGLTLSQTLDGGIINVATGPVSVDLIAGVTPTKTVDFDSSRPHFDTSTHRGFYGAMVSTLIETKNLGSHRPYAYVLFQQDYNNDEVLRIATTATNFNYNSHYVGVGSTGTLTDKLLYASEFVYEGGETLSNSYAINPPFIVGVDQTSNDIEAYAADIRFDYLFNDPYRTRMSAEFIAASGDDNRSTSSSTTFGGSKPGTKDRGFNAFGLPNTGLAFAPSASNLLVARGGVSSFPLTDTKLFRRMQVGGDAFAFFKVNDNAPIDEGTSNNSYLGWEPDVFINWQVTSDVTLAARYGIFMPSSDAFLSDTPRQFLSIGLTFGF
ncbi:hypothetical protein BH10PLA1_BH10PLA1_09500 [soil metagenome]